MTMSALAYAAGHPRSAGNGALMRTAPVGLSNLNDREATATATGWLQRVGLGDRLTARPDQLSGGQQRRPMLPFSPPTSISGS